MKPGDILLYDDTHLIPLVAGADIDKLAPLWDTAVLRFAQHFVTGTWGERGSWDGVSIGEVGEERGELPPLWVVRFFRN